MKQPGQDFICTAAYSDFNVGDSCRIMYIDQSHSPIIIDFVKVTINSYSAYTYITDEFEFDKHFKPVAYTQGTGIVAVNTPNNNVGGLNMFYPSYNRGDMIMFNQDWVCACLSHQCTLSANKGAVYEVEDDYGNEVTLIYLQGVRISKQYFDLYRSVNSNNTFAYRSYNPSPVSTGTIYLSPPVENQTRWSDEFNTKCINHKWKEYVGFTQRYNYCEICDEKQT